MANEHDHDAHAHQEHEHHEHHEHEHHAHGEPLGYADAVRAHRADKDYFFRTNPHSPIPAAEREGLEGLPYFDVDEALVFEGLTLAPYAGSEPTAFQIPTSDGKLRAAERAGTFAFEVGGTACRLTAYVFEGGDPSAVFVPFLDRTSGTETYGAGRYLDLEIEDDGTYALDFNLAYHPSCVYDARFSCPLTPAENRLPVAIEAGEKLAAGSGV
jgi:uncharacterized protein (DUF1684 family)